MGDVQVAIFFREFPDRRYRVSLRSKGEINVSRVAEHFGGGGHKCASGFSLEGPLAMAVAKVVDRLRVEAVEVNPASGRTTETANATSRSEKRTAGSEGRRTKDAASYGHNPSTYLVRRSAPHPYRLCRPSDDLDQLPAPGVQHFWNAAGSAILFWIALHPFQIGFLVLEGVWTIVSIWALMRPRAA